MKRYVRIAVNGEYIKHLPRPLLRLCNVKLGLATLTSLTAFKFQESHHDFALVKLN